MVRKTKLMLRIEEKYGQPLEKLLPRLYNERGLPAMAAEFGISKGTIWYWMLKFGINIQRVAVSPDEHLAVSKMAAG